MIDNTVTKLSRWLRSQLLRERASGKVVRLELRHLPSGAKQGQEVSTLDLREEKIDDSWFERQSACLLDEAQNDCDGISQGTQRYVLLVFREELSDRPRARFPFVMSHEREETEGYDSEPPNKAGVTQQLMRHLEAKERTFMTSLSTILGTMQRMSSTLSDENNRLREHQLQSMTAVEELLSMRHERELETKKSEARVEMLKDMGKDIKLLMPAIINRIGGQKQAQTEPQNEALMRFLESLNDEQRLKISSILTPTQQIALMEFVRGEDN